MNVSLNDEWHQAMVLPRNQNCGKLWIVPTLLDLGDTGPKLNFHFIRFVISRALRECLMPVQLWLCVHQGNYLWNWLFFYFNDYGSLKLRIICWESLIRIPTPVLFWICAQYAYFRDLVSLLNKVNCVKLNNISFFFFKRRIVVSRKKPTIYRLRVNTSSNWYSNVEVHTT